MEIKKFEPKTIETPTKETPKKVSPVVEKKTMNKTITKFDKFEVINEKTTTELELVWSAIDSINKRFSNLERKLRYIENRIN